MWQIRLEDDRWFNGEQFSWEAIPTDSPIKEAFLQWPDQKKIEGVIGLFFLNESVMPVGVAAPPAPILPPLTAILVGQVMADGSVRVDRVDLIRNTRTAEEYPGVESMPYRADLVRWFSGANQLY